MKRLVFLLISTLTVLTASATEEQYSNRRSSSAFTSDFSFEVIDERYSELESGAFFDKSSKLLVRYGVDERTYYGYIPGFDDPGSTIDVKITVTVEALDGIGTAIDAETVDMKVSYSPNEGAYQVDQAVFSFGGYNRYRISVSLPAAFPTTPPENLYIEGELIVDRYYEIETTTPIIGASSVDFSTGPEAILIAGTIIPAETDEIELWWDYIEGAEEYELEWTWIDNYGENSTGLPLEASDIEFTERDFELNNTRIITPHQRYRIPMIYSRGFIIYRVRGVGRWIDDGFENIDKVKYGPWSTQDDDLTNATVDQWNTSYLELEEVHEDGKNWQYQAVYAEDGKKKEIVSYFDGTLRNRQTTTRLNSNNEAIVGTSIYDNQGRAAIQVLPAPVNNPTLRYYKGLNRNSAGDLYTHQDFDWESDAIGTACLTTSSAMNNLYGASYYYSQNPAAEGNWQDFVPDAEGYPFVHTVYTPDNTGRIRAQSGVGPAFAIGGELNEDDRDRSTQYFYGQPYQEELDRLFGYKVGYKTRYKKNMVVDANGQVSVSYIDPQGRVIATALAGDNTQGGDGINATNTNLHSLNEEMTGNHDEMTVDLLNKILPYGPDEENDDNLPFSYGEIGPFNDGFVLNTQLINVSRDALYSFDYEVVTDVYTDPCMDASIAYPFGYDVYIDMKDDCGESVFGGAIIKNVSGNDVSGTYVGATGVDYSGPGILTEFDDIETTLDVGSYTLEKRITLDKEKMLAHLDHYMINNICLLDKDDFFNSTVDCFDDLDPSDPDYLSDFEISSCFVRKHMMLGDVMPGGQYGATDGEDLTSVFTIDNALDWGAETSVKNWQHPIKDGVTSNYLNEFGEISKVIVDYNGDVPANPDDFSAEISSDGIIWANLFGGLEYGVPGPIEVLPTHLLHLDDFIDNWDPAWAEYLVEYHPEYKYLSDFYDNGTEGICTKVYSGTTVLPDYSGGITSEQYDVALLKIETWAEANSTSNILGIDLVPVASPSSWEVFDNDPFNNLQYPAIDLDGTTVTDEYYFRLDLLTEILQNHKSLSSPLSMFQFASKVVLCGGDLGASCGYSDSQLADPASISGITTEQLDQIWNTYKMYYISEKKRIIQLFEDVYSLRNGANYDTGASGPPFYNGYIESSSPTLPAITAFTDYPSYMESDGGELAVMTLYDDAISAAGGGDYPWMDPEHADLFAEKVRRFMPVDVLSDVTVDEETVLYEMASDMDAAYYEETGKCDLLVDAELLLNALANDGQLDPTLADIPSTSVPEFTSDLYEDMGGTLTTGTVDIQVTDEGGMIKVVSTDAAAIATMKGIFIDNPTAGGWDDVSEMKMMYYVPGSWDGVSDFDYNFKIIARVELGGGDFVEEVLDGYTQVAIGECGYPQANCSRQDDFGNDLTALLAELYDGTSIVSASGAGVLTLVGAWYNESELATQLGDYAGLPVAEISTTSTTITINNPAIPGSTVTLDVGTGVPSDVHLITGGDYSAGILTVHYLTEPGVLQNFAVTVSTSLSYDLECDCEEQEVSAMAFQDLLYFLLTEYPTGYSDTEPLTGPEIGAIAPFIDGSGEDFGVASFNVSSPVSGVTTFTVTFTTGCTITMEIMNYEDAKELYGFKWDTDVTGDPIITGYAILGASMSLIPVSTSALDDCFNIECKSCVTQTIEPISCTNAWSIYNPAAVAFNGSLPAGVEAEFPTYTKEQFCNTNLAYVVDDYMHYLSVFGIDDPDDDHYITIAQFAAQMLNSGFEYYDDVTATTTDLSTVVDLYSAYVGGVVDPEPVIGWNNWVNFEYYPTIASDPEICLPPSLGFGVEPEFEYPCEELTENIDAVNASNQYGIYLENLMKAFIHNYTEKAMASLKEAFHVTYPDKEYHYTLFYYDQAGNLEQTVPPKGVGRFELTMDQSEIDNARATNATPENDDIPGVLPEHTYKTIYKYNSLNQLVYQETPDGGVTRFAYDALGRLIISQNAKQKNAFGSFSNPQQFSYTDYDDLGRIIEVGEITLPYNYTINLEGQLQFTTVPTTYPDVNHPDFPRNLEVPGDMAFEEVSRTIYDAQLSGKSSLFEDFSFDNTRNRIMAVLYFEDLEDTETDLDYDNATFYDYDVHGNVKEMVTDIADPILKFDFDHDQNTKTIAYDYELVSGNVDRVTYQKGQPDQFIHDYEYDADNRITNVHTSKDEVIWEQDAKYFYYDHGPLARMEIGDKKVQASDMAYTVQGWLKGTNSESLELTADQGRDGATGINSMVARDVCGYSLHYFEDADRKDYLARHGNTFLDYSEPLTNNTRSLYNGNIKDIYCAATGIDEVQLSTFHYQYEYDQLNRIKQMNQWSVSGPGGSPAEVPGLYESSYEFDANGNLENLIRYSDVGGSKMIIDNLNYHYYDAAGSETNQLEYVHDVAGDVYDPLVDGADDIGAQMDSNYVYNEIGELYSDVQEEIESIIWRVDGKIERINRVTGSLVPELVFTYDAMGNRISKETYDNATGDLIKKTFYFRDAHGNCMAVYNTEPTSFAHEQALMLTERSIYGSSRVGLEHVNQLIATDDPSPHTHEELNDNWLTENGSNILEQRIADRQYEMSNHLGNVLQVISDQKFANDAGGSVDYYYADVVAQNEYYPYGWTLPGRNASEEDYRYSFQGQEKDDEVKGKGVSVNYKYRMHDTRVGRFFKPDPLEKRYPHNSSYAFSENVLINAIELEGLEKLILIGNRSNETLLEMRINPSEVEDFELDLSLPKYSEVKKRLEDKYGITLAADMKIELVNKYEEKVEVIPGTKVDVDDESEIWDAWHTIDEEKSIAVYKTKPGTEGKILKLVASKVLVKNYSSEVKKISPDEGPSPGPSVPFPDDDEDDDDEEEEEEEQIDKPALDAIWTPTSTFPDSLEKTEVNRGWWHRNIIDKKDSVDTFGDPDIYYLPSQKDE